MRVCVTGGAGFIGSHLVDQLQANGHTVRVVDNYRTGRFHSESASYYRLDVRTDDLHAAFDGCDWVAHLAANADVRHGPEHPFYDLEVNTVGTARVLDAARIAGVPNVFFASTASVYGDLTGTLTETPPMPAQNSLYGASKLAGEALCQAYTSSFGVNTAIGRWVQVLGPRYLHGHVIDIIRKIRNNPSEIAVLGDGTQRKNGIHVHDLVRGITTIIEAGESGPFNLATVPTDFTINDSIDIITRAMGVNPTRRYTNELWVGDNPVVELDATRATKLGWYPDWDVPGAIEDTVQYLLGCDYL